MRCIARCEGEPLAHIADELEMDRTSLYRAITPMVRDGWLDIKKGSDSRSRSARLTRKGSAVLANAAPGWEQVQKSLIDAFGKQAWNALASEINRLADCADATQV